MISKIQSMDVPNTRAQVELRFHHLQEYLNRNKSGYPSNLAESLWRLRMLPSGRSDFLSVDELARLQMNSIYNIICMREALLESARQKLFNIDAEISTFQNRAGATIAGRARGQAPPKKLLSLASIGFCRADS